MTNCDDPLPEEVNCPNCGVELELEEKERIENRFICPKCNNEYKSDSSTSLKPTKQKGMSPRGKAQFVTTIAYAIAGIALDVGNHTYWRDGVQHDQSGNRLIFIVLTIIGLAFVAGSRITRWLAIGSCVVSFIGFLGCFLYPIFENLSLFLGQAIALIFYLVAFFSSIKIMSTSAEQIQSMD